MLDSHGAQPRENHTGRDDLLVGLIIVFAILLGAYFRFTGNNWDDFVRWHPDERYLTGQIGPAIGGPLMEPAYPCENNSSSFSNCNPDQQALYDRFQECLARYPDTHGVGGYFDTDCSPYNPENVVPTHYSYGTLPLFLARMAGEIWSDLNNTSVYVQYSGMQLVWRTLSALADTIVIGLVFLIGLRLHGKWTGALAAVLYSAAVLPIQLAHFGTTDAIANLFVTLAIFFAVRTQDSGSLWDYTGFGIALGAAVSSRINVAYLAGVIPVVALIRMLPAFDRELAADERMRLIVKHGSGVLLAALASLITFRLLNPYAFEATGIIPTGIDDRFLKTLAESRRNVSGEAESPPNWQWVNRTPYLFAFQNMVLWGMGIALGVAGWLAWLWTGWRIVLARAGGLRNVVPFVWIGAYFAFTGGLWVMSMRYYLPMYPALSVLAAWGLVALYRRASAADWRLRRLAAGAALAGVTAFTLLWAVMFTNIYRHQATFVQASEWVIEQVPGDFYTRMDGADEHAPLINIGMWNNLQVPDNIPVERHQMEAATRLYPGTPNVGTFVAPADGTISSVTAFRLVGVDGETDPQSGVNYTVHDSETRTVQIALAKTGDATPLATASITGSFVSGDHILGQSYEFQFDDPASLKAGQSYQLTATVEGGMMLVSGAVVANELPWDEPFPATVCTLPYNVSLADDPPSGLRDVQNCDGRTSWHNQVQVVNLDITQEDIPEKRERWETLFDQVDYIAVQTNRRYDSQSRIPARWPLTNRYYDALFNGELGFELVAQFQETFELGPLKVSDQYLPTYDGPQWLNEFEAEEAFHVYDHPVVFIFKKSDNYSSENTRAILNSVELMRAGTVVASYNNPMITPVMPLISLEADEAPTHLQLTPDMTELQQDGGTWSARFDRDSFLNRNQPVLVAVWWLAIMVFGWLAWPFLFLAFPALGDRGYGMAKFTGIMLVAWIAWVLGTLRIPAWSQMGLLAIMAVLFVTGAVIVWRNRTVFRAFVAERWKLLLGIELFALALFVLMVGIRLTNPDLWHTYYGGEKPMDFAYFNSVLRSTVFPPYDPWYAGGYINYYYFGFVIVGTPTLLLGVVPSIAYNLILPTVFSATGMAAFSLAFSVANGWWQRREVRLESGETTSLRRRVGSPWVAGLMALALAVLVGNLGTPGVFVNHVAAVGGHERAGGLYQDFLAQEIETYTVENQQVPDEITRLQFEEQARQYSANVGLLDHLQYEITNTASFVRGFLNGLGTLIKGDMPPVPSNHWFWSPTRVIAEIPNQQDGAINEMPFFTFLYGDLHAHMIAMPMMIFAMAFVYNELMTAGRDRRPRWHQALALFLGGLTVGLFQAANTWDFPTFLILSLGGLMFAWWLRWKPRQMGTIETVQAFFASLSVLEWVLAVAFIVVFLVIAFIANVVPYVVALFALLAGVLIAWSRLTRWSLLDFLLRVGGFVAIVLAVALPYTYWFASELTAFKIWEGKKTPLWAYLTIHGLFVFLIVSLLLWETSRWLRTARVRDLQGHRVWLLVALGLPVVVTLAALVIAAMDYQAALVVLPLVAWIGVLFFRPGQSRPMQFALVLAGLALCITLGTEFVTLANDNGRQNTIFKFGIQVWLMFSVVGGVAFAWIVRDSWDWRGPVAFVWYGVAGLLLFVAALYPIVAIPSKAEYRMTVSESVPLTLDGDAYMQYAQHWEAGLPNGQWLDLKTDYEIIRWLQDNVEGSPVIIEGMGLSPLYTWTGRISINTGLPTVIGWDYHQRQQRSLKYMGDLVNMRVANVNAFYSTPNVSEAVEILQYYNVQYVILGTYERYRYTAVDPVTQEVIDGSGIDKFDQMVGMGLLEVVYDQDGGMIYRVNKSALREYERATVQTEPLDTSLSDASN